MQRILILSATVFSSTAPVVAADQAKLSATFKEGAVGSLQFGGENVLADGRFRVTRVVLDGPEGKTREAKAEPQTQEATERGLHLRYPWGSVACDYRIDGRALEMDIHIENESKDATVQQVHMQAVRLALGGEPAFPRIHQDAFGRKQSLRAHENVDGPTVLAAAGSRASAVLCNRDFHQPPQLSLEGGETLTASIRHGGSGHVLDGVTRSRPIAPGKSSTVRISLFFGGPGADPLDLCDPILKAYGEAYPMTLDWPDRRPIMRLFPGGGVSFEAAIARAKDLESATARDTVDEKFRKRMLAGARRSVERAKAIDAQGIVVWEIEGTRYGNMIPYVGDPRRARWLNPQMDLVADEFFAIFQEAGLRPGVCIRPTRVVFDPEQETIAHSYTVPKSPFDELNDKIVYAKQRWDCSLFYIDTNIYKRPPEMHGRLLAPEVWRRLVAQHPDVLIIPELGMPAAYAYTASYSEMDMGSPGTPEIVRRIWPKAFGCLQLEDDDPVDKNDVIVAAVRHGDILMTNGGGRADPAVPGAYDEAAFLDREARENTTAASLDALRVRAKHSEPYPRWRAARQLADHGDKAVAVLGELLKDDVWAVRKAAAVALGETRSAAALPPLAEAHFDDDLELDYITARAMARLGESSIRKLTQSANGRGRHRPAAAIQALGLMGGEKGLDILLEMLAESDSRGRRRVHVYDAVGEVGTERAASALIRETLTHENYRYRAEAAQALANTGDPRAIPTIEKAIKAERARQEPSGHHQYMLGVALERARRMGKKR